MRLTFRNADFGALTALWNEFYPSNFRIDPELFELNTVKSPVFDWGVSQIEVDDAGQVLAFACFKRSAASLYKGPSLDRAHLSALAYRDPRVAVDLVADAKRVLRNRGVNRVSFGEDSRHFWPGCPCELGSVCGFLMVEGFVDGDSVFDLERDLSDYTIPNAAPKEFEYRPLSTDDDVVALRVFLEAEFPGRWLYDTMEKIRVEDDPGCVFGSFLGSKLVGFALIQHDGQKVPIGGAVWRGSLGEKWGALGPIGVADEYRGVGLGHGTLGSALEHLKGLGTRKCIIDWTTLEDFYGRHGFQISRRYKSSNLHLAD